MNANASTALAPSSAIAPGSTSIFRIDRLECPVGHRAVFEERLALIHGFFDTLPGCLYNRVTMAPSENEGMVKIVTIVEWQDADALGAAKMAAQAHYAQSGFKPADFMAEHGISGEFGTFLPVAR